MGSTRLHSDCSDALNICVYGEDGAEWVIIHQGDREKLHNCLAAMFPSLHGDLINSQKIFLTKGNIQQLRDQGIRIFEFCQKPGQAVCIPAGCPHQVRYPLLFCRMELTYIFRLTIVEAVSR
jgi:hypothetical protein